MEVVDFACQGAIEAIRFAYSQKESWLLTIDLLLDLCIDISIVDRTKKEHF